MGVRGWSYFLNGRKAVNCGSLSMDIIPKFLIISSNDSVRLHEMSEGGG